MRNKSFSTNAIFCHGKLSRLVRQIGITKSLLVLLALCLMPATGFADSFVNLTPKPKTMKVADGELVLPKSFVVSYGSLPDSLTAEAAKFVADFNKATGYEAKAENNDKALIKMVANPGAAKMGQEEYKLDITADGVTIQAETASGFFYAFQTIKKILPPNVMAGVNDKAVEKYALPLVSISDNPRFGYRGFMLDVARHFFTVEQVKRMIDLMAAYKMNRFHWHLSDDQGWRVEIKKYPKLTSVGSIAPNCWVVDRKYGAYWTNEQYGPYFYTQDQIKEVIAYAAERHIEVIPEIDMPGHFVAAMAAYPEFSCSPKSNHIIWTSGGISSDVLNVGNPKAVQFAKDILSEIIDMFPSHYIHIGGDECPTSAWQSNADCQKMYKDLKLTNYRQLQSHFIKDIADFIKSRGRSLILWNEAISADGADTKLIKETGATIMCWMPSEPSGRQAANLGLNNIITPWGPYYINRKQSTKPGEPIGAGDGTDNVQKTYNYVPVPSDISSAQTKYYTGVQGTFWCEHVANRDLLEYLALPRLMAIAEAGWTPQASKNFEDFRKRITADSTMLNYNGYSYNRDYMVNTEQPTEKVMPKASDANNKYWYRITTKATGERANKCIELLREGSPLISQYSGKNAKAGRLWTSAQAAEGDEAYDYQLWAFEKATDGSEKYALVCKAQPDGSVSPQATATNNSGRWDYDATAKHYDFVLGDNGFGSNGDGTYYYSIKSDKHNNLWMNASLGGQGYAVNIYNKPSDGNGGLWTMTPIGGAETSLIEKAKAMLDSCQALVANSATYTDEASKQIGLFGEQEKEDLQKMVNNAPDFASLSEDNLNTYVTSLEKAFDAFCKSMVLPKTGDVLAIKNAIDGYNSTAITDDGQGFLKNSDKQDANNAWEVTAAESKGRLQTTIRLKNKTTGRFISSPMANANGNVGFPVTMKDKGSDIVLSFSPYTGDFTVASGGKFLFPIKSSSPTLAGIVSSGSNTEGNTNAIRPQGTGWNVKKVGTVEFKGTDAKGYEIVSKTYSVDLGSKYVCNAPEVDNYKVVSYKETGTAEAPVVENFQGNKLVEVTYERKSYTVTVIALEQNGATIGIQKAVCPVGQPYDLVMPQFEYYTFASSDYEGEKSFVPEADLTIKAHYTSEALPGIKVAIDDVSQIEEGKCYMLYDAVESDLSRQGSLNIDTEGNNQILAARFFEGLSPLNVWTLEANGKNFKVKNPATGLYIPALNKGNAITASKNGGSFSFTKSTANATWTIKGTNNLYWNGNAGGSFTGWSDGHPFRIMEFFVQPYFTVKVKAVDSKNDKTLQAEKTYYVEAGSPLELTRPEFEGYTFNKQEGDKGMLAAVKANLDITLDYAKVEVGIDGIEMQNASNGTIYDLSGRRVHKNDASNGVFIIDGEKVIKQK